MKLISLIKVKTQHSLCPKLKNTFKDRFLKKRWLTQYCFYFRLCPYPPSSPFQPQKLLSLLTNRFCLNEHIWLQRWCTALQVLLKYEQRQKTWPVFLLSGTQGSAFIRFTRIWMGDSFCEYSNGGKSFSVHTLSHNRESSSAIRVRNFVLLPLLLM